MCSNAVQVIRDMCHRASSSASGLLLMPAVFVFGGNIVWPYPSLEEEAEGITLAYGVRPGLFMIGAVDDW